MLAGSGLAIQCMILDPFPPPSLSTSEYHALWQGKLPEAVFNQEPSSMLCIVRMHISYTCQKFSYFGTVVAVLGIY